MSCLSYSIFLLLPSLLIFEQIVECAARIVWLCGASRRSLLFNAHADGEKLAFVACIFLRDPLRNRLHALEATGRIEIRALLAGVQFEAALGALAERLGKHCQERAALRAARNRVRSRHVHGARSESVFANRTLRRGLLLFRAAVLISALAVFAVGQT